MVKMNIKRLKELYKKENYKQFNDYIVDYVDFYFGDDFSADFENRTDGIIFNFYWNYGFEGNTRIRFCKESQLYSFNWLDYNVVLTYNNHNDLIEKVVNMIEFCSGEEIDDEDKLCKICGSKVYDDFVDFLTSNGDYNEEDGLSKEQELELLNWYEEYLNTGEK